MSAVDYAECICASIGMMERGCATDHDTEASIAEHNLFNWIYRHCSTLATRESLSGDNAVAQRASWVIRIAWGPMSYFYLGLRHCGFKRRVDNLPVPPLKNHVLTRGIKPYCEPIKAGDGVSVIITKLLALCGLETTKNRNVELGEESWCLKLRICPHCEFAGHRTQTFTVCRCYKTSGSSS
jgi:hypothetical protein